MKVMPPAGSFRQRLAVGVLISFTTLFVVFIAYRFIRWIRHESSFPVLPLISSALGLVVALWGILLAMRDSKSSDSS